MAHMSQQDSGRERIQPCLTSSPHPPPSLLGGPVWPPIPCKAHSILGGSLSSSRPGAPWSLVEPSTSFAPGQHRCLLTVVTPPWPLSSLPSPSGHPPLDTCRGQAQLGRAPGGGPSHCLMTDPSSYPQQGHTIPLRPVAGTGTRLTSPSRISPNLPGWMGLLGGGYVIHFLLSPPKRMGMGPLCPPKAGQMALWPVGPAWCQGRAVPHPGGPASSTASSGGSTGQLPFRFGHGLQPGGRESLHLTVGWKVSDHRTLKLPTSDVLSETLGQRCAGRVPRGCGQAPRGPYRQASGTGADTPL